MNHILATMMEHSCEIVRIDEAIERAEERGEELFAMFLYAYRVSRRDAHARYRRLHFVTLYGNPCSEIVL